MEPAGIEPVTSCFRTRELRVETELAVEVGPGDTVAGLAVALEIIDTGRPPNGLEPIIAANVYHRGVAFGPTRAAATIDGTDAVGAALRRRGRRDSLRARRCLEFRR